MIKELEEDREESQDPEVEFAIAGAVREYGGLEIILGTIQVCFASFNREVILSSLLGVLPSIFCLIFIHASQII